MCSKQKKSQRIYIEDDNMNDAICWDARERVYMWGEPS